MAARIPINYRKSPEAITTFPFADISENTGTVVFFGASAGLSGSADTYFLSTLPTYSNVVASGSEITSGTAWTQLFDHDYDVKFNLPKRIKGKMRVTLTMGSEGDISSTSVDAYAHIKVRKFDGTTESDIIDKQSEVVEFPDSVNTPTSKTVNVELNITEVQKFRAGDILRVTIEIWGQRTGSQATRLGYAFDPKDRNDDKFGADQIIEDSDTTILEVHVPFLLNL